MTTVKQIIYDTVLRIMKEEREIGGILSKK